MKRDEGRGARDEWRRLIVWSWEVIGSYQLKRDEGRMAKVIRVVMGIHRHLPIETGRGTWDEWRGLFVWLWEVFGIYLLKRDEGRATRDE